MFILQFLIQHISDAQSLNDYNPIQQGVFASSSYTVLKLRKDVELWDICHNTLQKLPKAYNKVLTSVHL